jgi:hypothetical protein
MFYGKDSIENQFSLLENKLEDLFIFEPMPSYKTGERWTDEFRVRDGHTKLADGTWVTIHKATTYFQALQKSTTDLYEQYQETLSQLNLVRQQKREMEYGLRVAEKALNNSLALTKEMINE